MCSISHTLSAFYSFHLFNSSLIACTQTKTCQGLFHPPNRANPKFLIFTTHHFLLLLPLTQSLRNSCLPKPIVLVQQCNTTLDWKGFSSSTKTLNMPNKKDRWGSLFGTTSRHIPVALRGLDFQSLHVWGLKPSQ